MMINEYLEKHRKELEGLPLGMTGLELRDKVTCADGFRVSVQASHTHYCTPREDNGPYSHVELGFPSDKDELIQEYAESPDDPTGTVYPWVPVEIVSELIMKHGGFKEAT